MYCAQCGTSNADANSHCLKCGNALAQPVAAESSHIAGTLIAKPASRWATVLIVLAGVISVLGIVAAIAIPAYRDYTARAQVSEGLILASNVKAAVEEYMAETGNWPVDLGHARLVSGGTVLETAGNYVESIAVHDGTITITYGRAANSRIAGFSLSLQPLINAFGDVVWRCGHADDPPDTYVNSAGAAGSGTDSTDGTTNLGDKYVPASCRSGFRGS